MAPDAPSHDSSPKGFYHQAAVGRRRLMWCQTHGEPAWVYRDGGVACWFDCIVEQSSDDHELVPFPSDTSKGADS